MKKRILEFVLTLVLIMGLFPIMASAAEEIKYMDWDDSSKTLVEKTATAEKLTAETNVENIAGWYYVDGTVEINSLINVKIANTAHIILTNGSKLTASQGILFLRSWDTHLYIYGQADGSGELVADGEINCTSGSLTINGGTVTANNGIHCKDGDAANFIMINGGTVTATGGTNSVGIGNNTSKQNDATKQIIINGGTVTAIGGNGPSDGNGAAGIVGKVTINGGTVTATGGKKAAGVVDKVAAGIVGHDGSHYSGKGVTINGGTVTATGITGDLSVYALGKITASYDYSAGDSYAVSLEDYMDDREHLHYIHIEPRTKDDVAYMDWDSEKKEWVEKTVSAVKIDPQITALADGCWYYVDGHVDKGDESLYDRYYPIRTEGTAYIILKDGCEFTVGAGIEVPSGKSLFIYGQELGTGKLNVTGYISDGDNDGIGIGGHGSSTVTINGGTVMATGGDAIGIGGEGSTVTINRGTVTATSGDATGIGGDNSTVTINGGTVTADETWKLGIGGKGSTVTINGGTVTATGDDAPGIGGNYGMATDGSITVTGGELTVYGSTKATNVAKGNINATVQTSTDGTTWSDWDEKTELTTYKYLKLTAAHTHTLNKVEAKDATCTEDGISTTYYVCEGEGSCGKYFSDENGENEISAETAQGYTIVKMGHNFTGNYINYEGNKWAKKCSRCDTYDTENALTGVAVPTAKTGLVYNGDTQTGVEAGTGYTIESNTGKDAGTYTATAKIADGYIWADGTLIDKPIEWSIAKATVAVPTITGQVDNMFLFTGEEIVALEENEYYTVEGGSATATGKYTAKVTPTKNYEWTENFDGEIEWYIVNAEYYLTDNAPKADGTKGKYNQRSYYIGDEGQKVVLKEGLSEQDWECAFEPWYLRSMMQYKMVDNNYDIRFISMLNGECFNKNNDGKYADYDYAGFIVNVGGADVEIKTTVGYTSFLAAEKVISIADYSDNPADGVTDVFFLANTTFATEDISDDTPIKVTPFVKLIDGETILKGKTATFTLSQLIK